jgi:hypothetical protein
LPLSSWGGNVIHSGGIYHLFAAVMTRGCNLGSWTSNSFVMHSTSTNAAGPFAYRNVALRRRHHNPQVVLAADGTWCALSLVSLSESVCSITLHCGENSKSESQPKLAIQNLSWWAYFQSRVAHRLLYTVGTVGVPDEHDCRNSTGGRARAVIGQGRGSRASLGGPLAGKFVQLHHSRSPDEPWIFLNSSGSASNPGIFSGGLTTNHEHGTNPAPVELPNGAMVVGAHDDIA